MTGPGIRGALFLAGTLAAAAALTGPAAAQSPPRADFSGSWALDEKASENPSDRMWGGDQAQAASSDDGPASRARQGVDVTADVPLEALGDARRISIADDGATLRIAYRSGRKRTFFPDGVERELDDGDGPAHVVASRSGDKGRRVVVTSRWSSGRRLTETWELLSDPRRIAVSGKVAAHRSFTYRRVYVPAPPEEPTPAPTATSTPLPAAPPSASPVSRGAMSDCSIRPPRGTDQEELARMAKISSVDAESRAVKSIAPARVTSVISSGVEVDRGCLVFSFDLRLADKRGVQEVIVDAGDGRILSSEFEAQ